MIINDWNTSILIDMQVSIANIAIIHKMCDIGLQGQRQKAPPVGGIRPSEVNPSLSSGL
jgi:hypothetical protein